MSLWGKYLDDFNFDKLSSVIETDVLIIGGGITGLTTLYYLKDYESVCLVDANRIGTGVTKNTTGKLTFLQGAIYSELEKNINYDVACKYLESQQYAIKLIKEIIQKEKIKCDLENVSSYVYAMNEKDVSKLKREKVVLESNKIKVKEYNGNNYKYAISVDDTYVYNPIKYLNELKRILKDKQIYENTLINKIKYIDGSYHCYSDSGKIIAKKVIITCHYPFFLLPFFLPSKSYIEKSYLIAYKVDKNEHCSGITVSNPGFSYRYYQDGDDIYKICLGSSHNTAVKQNDLDNFENVKKIFNISEKDIVAKWSNVDIITGDKLPYIGEIQENLYIGTGFSTWGMTNGIVAAKILSDTILNKQNLFANFFKIHRMNLYKIKSTFINVGSTVISFINSHFRKEWYSNRVKFENRNGIPVAIYIDEKGNEHVVINRCPHVKCALIFNEEEKTWDCPCHSSRFDIDGNCIKGPSKKNISYKK